MHADRYLLVKGKAGLGNRLLSAFGALLYARLAERQLYLDWSDLGYSTDGTNSFPRYFDRPVLCAPEPLFAKTEVAPPIWRGQLQRPVDELMIQHDGIEADEDPRKVARYTVDFARLERPEEVLVRWSFFDDVHTLRRHFAAHAPELVRLSDEDVLRRVIQEELVPAAIIRDAVADFARRHFGEVTIGVHVRHSDRKNSYSGYPAIIRRILARHPGARIFLATDNVDVERYFRERFENLSVTEKWFGEAGVPLHRGRRIPNKFDVGVEALIELYLLARCQYLVYNRTSSFALVANLLSEAPASQRVETSTPAQRALDLLRRIKRALR
jgi:hypothetical protein